MKMNYLLFFLISPLLFLGCKKEEDEGSEAQLLPSISDAVNKARPDGLESSSDLAFVETESAAAEALKDFFTDKVASLGGHTKEGWIDAYLYDLDQRLLEVKGDTEPDCLKEKAVTIAFDTGAGYSIDLKLNCLRSFEVDGDQSGSGSGLAYGKDDKYYYIYVMLSQKDDATQKFGYAASYHIKSETVDLLFLERNPKFNRTKFFALKTTPKPKSFAFAVAGTGDGPGPVSKDTAHTLSPGVRFIADNSALRVEGSVGSGTDKDGEIQNSPAQFDSNECFSPANLAKEPEACTSSAPTFADDLPLVSATSMPDHADDINSALYSVRALKNKGVKVDDGPPPPEDD